ncbi:hypothetical protein C3B51_22485 [Pseudoalteromonas rubra]|uniref:Uncharacterized protein n=1 Tax=Pseudoalteromonas rubra TaxID=43658 RepID=A0A4V2E1H4_9GAMM|nr:hypothetical protein [Pseudoalteromonas rubra]RZM71813.1 hypothetical protein C3B51_22485 [Pseudoalteromonas rubra]
MNYQFSDRAVAMVHTHGQRWAESAGFSGGDYGYYKGDNPVGRAINGYLANPYGELLKFDAMYYQRDYYKAPDHMYCTNLTNGGKC